MNTFVPLCNTCGHAVDASSHFTTCGHFICTKCYPGESATLKSCPQCNNICDAIPLGDRKFPREITEMFGDLTQVHNKLKEMSGFQIDHYKQVITSLKKQARNYSIEKQELLNTIQDLKQKQDVLEKENFQLKNNLQFAQQQQQQQQQQKPKTPLKSLFGKGKTMMTNPLNHHESPNPCSDGSDVEMTSSFGLNDDREKPYIRPIRTETPQISDGGGSLLQSQSQTQNQPKVKLKDILSKSPMMEKRFQKITPTSTPTQSPFSTASFTAPASKFDSMQPKNLGPQPRNSLPKPSPLPNFSDLGKGSHLLKFEQPKTQKETVNELEKLLFNSNTMTATAGNNSSSQQLLGNSPQLPRLAGLKTPRTPLSQLKKPNLLLSPFAFKK